MMGMLEAFKAMGAALVLAHDHNRDMARLRKLLRPPTDREITASRIRAARSCLAAARRDKTDVTLSIGDVHALMTGGTPPWWKLWRVR